MRDAAMRFALVTASLLAFGSCAGKESSKGGAGSAAITPTTRPTTRPTAMPAATPPPTAPAPAPAVAAKPAPEAKPATPPPPDAAAPSGHDFTPAGMALFVVGACGDGAQPEGFAPQTIAKHCTAVKQAQDDYKSNWVTKARTFFAEKVPSGLPKKVVYPFAGGDLSTALTVYPDADEITTLSLEPAGDPRTLAALNARPPAKPATLDPKVKPAVAKSPKALEKALGTIAYELRFLYRVNFSNTMNMISAMRAGALPTQLVFGLSALKVHDYEVVSLRYFKLDPEGAIEYLTDEEVAEAPDPLAGRADARNRIFANAEVRFRKPGGRIQTYRHIQFNLDDNHMKKDPRLLKHLEAKGPISGMTKAASYLLSFDSFSIIRGYLIRNVQWMVSDATGVAPKWGKPAGFEYETHGVFRGPHIPAGGQISKNWESEFAAQTRRPLAFRFGYYDSKAGNTLVIMKKKS